MTAIDEHLDAFAINQDDLVSEEELVAKLGRGKPLRIKYGCDPSAPDLHLGHSINLDKLRRFQELGHRVIFLVGDFTAMIGDPSGRSKTRPALSRDEVNANAETYVNQVSAILDRDAIEVRFNSEWMDAMTPADFIRLAAHHPVARMLERDDFKRRFREGISIGIHELLYPLVQAYDSVALEADVEIGGSDQLFNLLLGREIQRDYGQEAQIVLTAPLLEGTDGTEKMSKSLGNAIGIRDEVNDMYGKVMSVPDSLLDRWIELLAQPDWDLAPADASPRDRKAGLARAIVGRFHGADAGEGAEAHFDRVFRQHRAPADMAVVDIANESPEGVDLLGVLRAARFAASGSEARRLIGQGGVKIDEQRVSRADFKLAPGDYTLQVGKRRFARIRVAGPPRQPQ